MKPTQKAVGSFFVQVGAVRATGNLTGLEAHQGGADGIVESYGRNSNLSPVRWKRGRSLHGLPGNGGNAQCVLGGHRQMHGMHHEEGVRDLSQVSGGGTLLVPGGGRYPRQHPLETGP